MSVETTRLPSGLVVVTDEMPDLETASLGVWVNCGSRNERPDEHGVSHFLEHMAFKGTEQRSARQIAESIETVGGDLNAATGVEVTAYYARMLKADVPLALDVLADILSHPRFDPDEITRERNVIIQEIGALEDTPDDLVFDFLQATAYASQPLGHSILGTPESVRAIDAAKLRSYLARNYGSPTTVIAAAGAIKHDAIVEKVDHLFTDFGEAAPTFRPPATFTGGVHIESRDLEQAHIALALEGLPQRDSSLYSLQVFTNILGGGMSSRLFQEVREERGLCYSIYAFHAPYVDTGMFGLYAGTDAADAQELMRVIVGEMEATADGLTEVEVARAKAQMKSGLLMALESSGARAEQLARHMIIHGRVIPVDEIVSRVDSVTVDTAREAGRALMARSRPAVAVLGPGRLEGAAAIAESLALKAA